MVQQGGEGRAVVGVHGDTDAGPHLDQLARERHRPVEVRGELTGDACCLCGRRQRREPGQEHDELVAAQAREQVAAAQPVLQPPGDGEEQLVAGRVAVRVVDGLEAVEVEEQQGQRVSPTRASHSATSTPLLDAAGGSPAR